MPIWKIIVSLHSQKFSKTDNFLKLKTKKVLQKVKPGDPIKLN